MTNDRKKIYASLVKSFSPKYIKYTLIDKNIFSSLLLINKNNKPVGEWTTLVNTVVN